MPAHLKATSLVWIVLAAPLTAGEIHEVLESAEADEVTEKIRSLISKDRDVVRARDEFERTPLHVAARNGHLKAAGLLLESGADANARAYDELTPLHLAATPAMVKLLIEHRCDLDAEDSFGLTALRRAAARSDRALARLLISAGAKYDFRSAVLLGDEAQVRRQLDDDPRQAHVKDKYGYTPLHWAARDGFASIVKLLLEHKAEVEAKGYWEDTPLVSGLEHAAVVERLLAAGADARLRMRLKGTPSNATLLHLAAGNGWVESARLLLRHGLEVNARSEAELTPLHVAASAGHREMVQLLLEHKADPHARSSSGATAMALAVGAARPEPVPAADAGSESRPDYRGVIAALHARGVPLDLAGAITLGELDDVVALLKADPSLAAGKDPTGSPLLHRAVEFGRKSIVERLLASGAPVNLPDRYGDTALHCAAFRGDAAIASVLIEHKAELRAKNDQGQTPLAVAQRAKEATGDSRFAEVVELLLKAGRPGSS